MVFVQMDTALANFDIVHAINQWLIVRDLRKAVFVSRGWNDSATEHLWKKAPLNWRVVRTLGTLIRPNGSSLATVRPSSI